MAEGTGVEATMPVELAIQRELAYRRKLAWLQVKPDFKPEYDESFKDFSPLQVQSWSQSSSLNHPNASNLSGTKRKEPASALQPMPLLLQKQQPFHESLMLDCTSVDHRFQCKLCNVECSSQFNLEQHVIGQKHKARLLQFRENNDSEEMAKGQRRWCEVCRIPCMNEQLLRLHLEGKKHKAKLKDLELSRRSEQGEIPADWSKLYCELCQVWCIDECSLKQHVEGRRHKLQALAL
ncbi:TFIIH C1-like domain containing protein [Trema orientale]|uniref:TFIIH C1-like domain containing protein n=1 Tax=Trema orientale TaxID=63057 RepID=A0A2P5FW03_TREOI|nr:TFIIH C1-like domain containing protein [Trema orientale]